MGTLKIPSPSQGHVEIKWDSENPTEVKVAEAAFNKARSEGLLPHSMKKGKPNEQLDSFDATQGEVIFTAPLAGG